VDCFVRTHPIGLSAREEAIMRGALKAPFGMIVTGPSGSGKTTTLVASLSVINEQSRNILTVADPTEYQITGVSQTQLRARSGLTFATALRSFLRRDPDVIMVGEMGAAETALIGVHAALTGHLVPGCIQIPPRVWSRVIDRESRAFLSRPAFGDRGSALFVEALKAQPSAGARIRIDLCASR
jgi:Tfp pilus assembly pilus retraction ATPase PilT